MQKTLSIILSGVLVISLVFALAPNQAPHQRMGRRGHMGYYMEDEFYEKHEELFDQKDDEIEDLYDEMEDIQDELEDAVDKEDPNWDAVENLMEQQRELSNEMWKIRKEVNLKVLKSLDADEREEFVERYCSGKFMGHMGRGYQHMEEGHHRGHMR